MRFPIGVLLFLAALTSVGAGEILAQAPAAGAKPKVVLITGSTSGLGRELALQFGAQGATVIVHGRNRADGQAVVAEIEKGGKGHAHFFAADFASLAQVRALADSVTKNYQRLDVLIDNAGVYDPNTVTRTVTPDGNEQAFQVNYLAQVLLTERLKPLLVASAPSRVVIIASGTQYPPDLADLNLEHDYNGSQGYGRSKAAGVMYAIDLAAELKPKGVIVNSVHPGTQMDTPMIVSLGRIPVTTIQQGAAAVMNAVNNDVGTGQLFMGMAVWRSPVPPVYDTAFRSQLRTIAMSAIHGGKIPSPPPLAVLSPERTLVSWNGGSTPPNGYRIGADTTVAHGGRASEHVTARSTAVNASMNTGQTIRAADYIGKRIRYAAYLRTKGLGTAPGPAAGAGLWMRVDGNGGMLSFDNTQTRWLKGTNDWTRMEIVLDVPTGSAAIIIGTLAVGPGEFWVDDASFEIVGSDVAVTNAIQATSNPAQAAAMAQMYANAPPAPTNLDYEQLGNVPPATTAPVAVANEKAPMTWSGTSTPPEAYRFGLDPQVKHAGASSGHIATAAGPGIATLFQSVRAASYRGKRVRFTAWVRSRGLATAGGAGARLVLIAAGNGSALLASDQMQTRMITGTTEWTQYSLVVDVPQAAAAVQIGLAMAGAGEAWIDDATLDVVGNDVPVTGAPGPAAAAASQAPPNEFLGLPTQPSNLDFEKANGP